MTAFRKKPVVIEAFQWQGDFDALDTWLNALGYSEDGDDGKDGGPAGMHEDHNSAGEVLLLIPTLEGEMTAKPGDWIIRGVKGEFYPCKPDIFALTYEPAAASPAAAPPSVAEIEDAVLRAIANWTMATPASYAQRTPLERLLYRVWINVKCLIEDRGLAPVSAPSSLVDQACAGITTAIRTAVHAEATEDGDHFSHQFAVPDAASPTGGRPTPAPTRSDALRALAAELRALIDRIGEHSRPLAIADDLDPLADRLDALAASIK